MKCSHLHMVDRYGEGWCGHQHNVLTSVSGQMNSGNLADATGHSMSPRRPMRQWTLNQLQGDTRNGRYSTNSMEHMQQCEDTQPPPGDAGSTHHLIFTAFWLPLLSGCDTRYFHRYCTPQTLEHKSKEIQVEYWAEF